jgi:CRP/FNR family cyclic AMP-dependent transcriptional regulator
MTRTLSSKTRLRFLDGLSGDAQRAFRAITRTNRYQNGSILFSAGQAPLGIFMLHTGKVKLSTASSKGKSITLRVAKPGDILGLSAALKGSPCELTAEIMGDTKADFVTRADFLRFLDQYPESYFQVVQMLSREVAAAHERVRLFRRAQSACGRLAALLMEWCAEGGVKSNEGICLTVPLAERDIGHMIGTSRETVARLLAKLKDKRIAQRNGHGLLILDQAALESIARSQVGPSKP